MTQIREQIKLGVSAIIAQNIDDELHILLGQRPMTDTAPGFWVTPGGGVEYHETIDMALIRETREESGLMVLPVNEFVTVQELMMANCHHLMVFKVVHCLGDADPKPTKELIRFIWVSLQSVVTGEATLNISAMTHGALIVYHRWLMERRNFAQFRGQFNQAIDILKQFAVSNKAERGKALTLLKSMGVIS